MYKTKNRAPQAHDKSVEMLQLLVMLLYADSISKNPNGHHCDEKLLGVLLQTGSSFRKMQSVLDALRFHEANPFIIDVCPAMRSGMNGLFQEDIERLTKQWAREHLQELEARMKLAAENRTRHAEYMEAMNKAMFWRFPAHTYEAVCKRYPVTRDEYLEAAHLAIELLFRVESEIMILLQIHTVPGPKLTPITEDTLLQWMGDEIQQTSSAPQNQEVSSNE